MRAVDPSSGTYGTQGRAEMKIPDAGTTPSTAFALGATTVYYDGTNDHLKLAAHNDWSFGTGDFTVEAWIYPTEQQDQPIVGNNSTGTASHRTWELQMEGGVGGGNFHVNFKTGTTILINGGSNYSINTWHHVAAVRTSGSLAIYVDGTLDNTTQATIDFNQRNELWIGAGANNLSSNMFQGYMDEVRVSNIARYPVAPSTNSFTLQTKRHVPDVNTMALVHMYALNQTITLPSNPTLGDTVTLMDVGGNCTLQPVYVIPGLNLLDKINKQTDIVSIDENDAFVTFVYSGSQSGAAYGHGNNWMIVPRQVW